MKTIIGHIPKESGFKAVMRKHQGWWRAFVLNEPEGAYSKENLPVCNRINNGKENPHLKNFLSKDITKAVALAQQKQKEAGKGIMEEDRLYNNLLSSQPLAFNFFGWFHAYPDIALGFLQTLIPDITDIDEYLFEYAPKTSTDGSAFDIGFVVRAGKQKGFVGFESKYTDKFSYKRSGAKVNYGDKSPLEEDKNYNEYYALYKANPERFQNGYFSYVRDNSFNQLFRNELLAIQLLEKYDFVRTGLFCHHDDISATHAGREFRRWIGNSEDDFILLTYSDYIERMQKLDLNWEQRELVMMLWARYCGNKLSNKIIEQLK